MIGYGAVLRLNLFFDNCWYSNMFANSYFQVSHTLIMIGLIAESTLKLIKITEVRSLGIRSLKWKELPNLVLFLNTICNLQQLCMFYNDFFNWHERTRIRDVFSTVRVASFTTCILSINLLKHLFKRFSG